MTSRISLGANDPPLELREVVSVHFFSLGMRTFLAGFCAPGSPLAKALGILVSKLKNQPRSLGANYPPWEFREVGSEHFFSLRMRHFWRVFTLL
jgi:hypothetical protein